MNEPVAGGNIMRVGIFGAGKMAMHHIQAIRLLGNSKIVAIADPAADPHKLKSVLPEDIPIFSSPEELLEETRPEIVHVCTPPHTHAGLARLALNHGSNVYIEKPFTLLTDEAREIVSLAGERRRKVCAGHQLLFESQMATVKERLGTIGRIVHVESYFSFRQVRRSMDGRTPMGAIDQLIDILPHPVYLLQYFLKRNHDEDVPIEIRGMHVRSDGNVHGILTCGETTGILVVTLTGRPIESYVKVIGTNGSLCAEFVRGTFVINPGPGISGISKVIYPYSQAWQNVVGTTKALFRRVRKKQKSYPGLLELIGAFHESVRSGKGNVVSPSSILETVAVCEEVAVRLRSHEEAQNRAADADFRRREDVLPPAVPGRGKILVTGGTGMLGRAVAAGLRENGYEVRTISRKRQPLSERIPGVEYCEGDLGGTFPEGFLQGVAAVVHCAAETAGGREAHEKNSVGATRNLLQAMASCGVKRLVHISSLGVLKTSRETGRAVDEKTAVADDPEARGPYVWGKAVSERIALEKGRELGIDVRIIRPGPLVDYDEYTPPGRLGREVGPFFILVGSRRDKLSLCDVKTAAAVIRRYLESFEDMPTVLNLIEPDAPTRGELVDRLLKERPDLSVLRIPTPIFRGLSVAAKLLQRVIRPERKPIDAYAAFACEKYDASLARRIIKEATAK